MSRRRRRVRLLGGVAWGACGSRAGLRESGRRARGGAEAALAGDEASGGCQALVARVGVAITNVVPPGKTMRQAAGISHGGWQYPWSMLAGPSRYPAASVHR